MERDSRVGSEVSKSSSSSPRVATEPHKKVAELAPGDRGSGEVQVPTTRDRLLQRLVSGRGGEAGARQPLTTRERLAQSFRERAEAGTANAPGEFPHRERIETSFGRPISASAHRGAGAAAACQDLGAEAYTYGNAVAFKSSTPSLHTAAHEAAHTLQQARGIQLKGGVGKAGDRHEQEADEAAGLVVQGKSAAHLFPNDAGSPSRGGGLQMQDDKKKKKKKKKKTPVLDDVEVEVPAIEDFSPADLVEEGPKYQWQNETVRAALYPNRKRRLEEFLITFKRLELGEDPGPKLSKQEADNIRANIGEEQEEAAEHLERNQEELETLEPVLAKAPKKSKKSKKSKKKLTPEEQKEVDEARARKGYLDSENEVLKGQQKSMKKLAKSKDSTALRMWQFEQDVHAMDHDQLVAKVLDEFDADADGKRFPPWLRYAVLHLSGIRYESAHGSWASPQELLVILKQSEVQSAFADEDTRDDAAAEAKEGLDEEVKAGGSSKGKAQKERVALQKKIEKLERLEELITEAQSLTDLDTNEKKRDELKRELGVKKVNADVLAKELEKAQRSRRELLKNEALERAAREMRKLTEPQARALLRAMQDQFPKWVWEEIVSRTHLRVEVAQPVKPGEQVSDDERKERDDEAAYWKGVLGRSDKDLKESLAERAKEAKGANDQATLDWIALLRQWPIERSGWRKEHSKELDLVASRLVCNEVGEHIQHARGLDPSGGIRGSVGWYARKEAKAAEKAAEEGKTLGKDGPFLRRADKIKLADIPPGASVFWLNFLAKPKYDESKAKWLGGGDLAPTIDGKPIKDGATIGQWTYHVDPTTEVITRTIQLQGPAEPGKDPPQKIQYANWKHEATVVKPLKGMLLLFETNTGAGITERKWDKLVNPPGDDNPTIYIGYAPGGTQVEGLEDMLKDIQPGRDANPKSP